MPTFTLAMTPEAEKQIETIMNDRSRYGLQKQIKKAFGFLSENPRHPSLHSHLLENSEKIYGVKVWTSYVQNNTPQAHRILWTYGQKQSEIIILNVIPHY